MTVATDRGMAWLASLPRFGIRPGLSRTRRVLDALGSPDEALCFFHVAGTNGKGSVCAFLHALLSQVDRIGVFTSPAYDGFRARFRVGDDPIAMDDFARIAEKVRRTAEQVCSADDPLTEFEALTVMAILYFAEQSVRHVVWETGLGGRYDSTNVVLPVVTGITNVSLDHTEILGDTIRAIAWDKAGIAKRNVSMVTTADDVALSEIQRVTETTGAPLYSFRHHFTTVREDVALDAQTMSYRGLTRDLYHLRIPLFGVHQCTNAALAMAMAEVASQEGVIPQLTDESIRRGIASTQWPGRFEVWRRGTFDVILDGAHNAAGASALATSLAEYTTLAGLKARAWTMVIGVLADKDADMMLHQVLPFAKRVIVAAPSNPRAMSSERLAEAVRRVAPNVSIEQAPDVVAAMRVALGATSDPVCCWGSLYTVDEARRALREVAPTYGRATG